MAEPDQQSQSDSPALSYPMAMVRAIGALALVGCLSVVTLSVIGRHLNISLPGSIEIVELLIVMVAASSILYATVARSHAAARLFVDRLSPRLKSIVDKCGLIFGACICLALTIGNLWLLYDVWSLHEVTPLLGIPVVPFRIVFIAATACTTAVLIWQLFKEPR